MEITAKQLEDLKSVLKIQGDKGNWNYDEYMRGMYNGMELMMAIVEGREPEYRSTPDEYVHDKTATGDPVPEPNKEQTR